MTKAITTILSLFLIGGNAAAQTTTTECETDRFGTMTCETYSSNRNTFNPATSPITYQERRSYGGIDTSVYESMERIQMRRDQIQRQERIEAQNAPEWQQGGLVNRVEGQSPTGTSLCVYQTATGRTWLQGKAYDGGFSATVPRAAQCPQRASISKTTGERKPS